MHDRVDTIDGARETERVVEGDINVLVADVDGPPVDPATHDPALCLELEYKPPAQ
jgi:hypothetical protein